MLCSQRLMFQIADLTKQKPKSSKFNITLWSDGPLAVCEQRCRGLKLTLLPEDQQVPFLVGMYVMLSKAYVPNCRPNEAKAKKLGGFNTTLFPGGPPPQY